MGFGGRAAAHGLKQETDSGAIEALIDGVLAAKGKAPPAVVNEILKKKLG